MVISQNGGTDMANARKAGLSLLYKGSNVKSLTKDCVESFTFTDIAYGESDSIELTLNNSSFRFMNKEKPCKGDKIGATIQLHNWNKNGQTLPCKCGSFVLDDLSFSEPPRICEIGAVAMPVKSEFKSTKRTKPYKNVSLKEIARTIAKRAGVALHYSAKNVHIKEIEQSKTPDSEFLTSLCEEYGLGLKIFKGKIVIFDIEDYEKKKSIKTINRKKGVINWTWNTTLQGTYTGAKVSYTDPDDNKNHHMTIGKKGRMLDVNITAFSKKDAELKAKAKLAEENRKRTTMTLSIFPDPRIVAGATVRMDGFYKLSGKYFVQKVTHRITGKGAYSMTLDVYKVNNRIGMGSASNSSGGSGGMAVYDVKRGDSLDMLAKKYFGNMKYRERIYSQNKSVIEEAAKKAGHSSSKNGKILIRGTKLKITT